MKNSWDHKKTMMEEPLLESTQKGGLRALPFIIGEVYISYIYIAHPHTHICVGWGGFLIMDLDELL